MALSRRRKKELARLRREAETLWGNQQVVFDHAGHVAREAGRQIGQIQREVVIPRMQSAYEQVVLPRVSRAAVIARQAGGKIERDVLPAVGRTIGTVLAAGDIAREARVQRALGRIAPVLGPAVAKKRRTGSILGFGFVLTIVGLLGYAAWQTFRADDDLWVADESDLDS